MSDESCDIHDVTRAASDLVAFGCSIGATQLFDSFRQLQFSEMVSTFANKIIRAVDEGLVSAQQGLQEIKEEYSELSKKTMFYSQNAIGVAAGVIQIQTGGMIAGNSKGRLTLPALFYLGHGFNNTYEGFMNIYNGPTEDGEIGPIRKLYRFQAENDKKGDLAYYSVDLGLSAYGLIRPARKKNSFELFNKDPINYESAYHQMGSLALALEVLINSITIENMTN